LIKLQNLVANWQTEFHLVYLLETTGALDVTDSPLIPPESKQPVQNAEEKQGTCRHSTKLADGLPSLCTLHLIGEI